MSLSVLQDRVRAWSLKNFGNQRAKHGQLQGNDLHGLAPLLGMCEEYGELELALETKNEEGVVDAIGDIGIYFLDYTGRTNVAINMITAAVTPRWVVAHRVQSPPALIRRGIAFVQRAHLKQAQGIRGFDKVETFTELQCTGLAMILTGLYALAADFGLDFEEVVGKVAETVLARDWVANPTTATAPEQA